MEVVITSKDVLTRKQIRKQVNTTKFYCLCHCIHTPPLPPLPLPTEYSLCSVAGFLRMFSSSTGASGCDPTYRETRTHIYYVGLLWQNSGVSL